MERPTGDNDGRPRVAGSGRICPRLPATTLYAGLALEGQTADRSRSPKCDRGIFPSLRNEVILERSGNFTRGEQWHRPFQDLGDPPVLSVERRSRRAVKSGSFSTESTQASRRDVSRAAGKAVEGVRGAEHVGSRIIRIWIRELFDSRPFSPSTFVIKTIIVAQLGVPNAIQSFKVIGLNRRMSFGLQFHEDINIVTGKNGSGKTTLLKLLWYAISGNLERIIPEIQFESFELETDKLFVGMVKEIKQKGAILKLIYKIGDGEKKEIEKPLERSTRWSRTYGGEPADCPRFLGPQFPSQPSDGLRAVFQFQRGADEEIVRYMEDGVVMTRQRVLFWGR